MRNFIFRAVLPGLVVLSLCFATAAFAENRAGAFTVSPMVGAQVFSKTEGIRNAGFLGLNLGYNFTKNWGAELVGTAAIVDNRPSGTGDFNYWTGRVDLLYHFQPEETLVPYLVAGVGGAFMANTDPVSGDSVNEDFIANYGVGIKLFTSDLLALRLDARHALRHEVSYKPTTHGKNYSNFMFSGGLTYQIGGEKVAVMQQADSDGDGVIDSIDQCSGSLAGAEVDAQGCVPVVEMVALAEVVADADADGIADKADKCPNTPTDVPVNERGCPADTDQDGVFDVDDQCPDTEAGKSVDPDGCEVDYSAMEELKLEITFASNSSVVGPEFKDVMQQAADFVKAHPGKKLLVEGYTDNTGSEAANQRMSQKRADTVRWILVRDYGADKTNLTAKGFGEENPIGDNTTQDGRLANRRVVIKIVD